MSESDKVQESVVESEGTVLNREEEEKIESEVMDKIEPKLFGRFFQMESYRGAIPPQILEKIDSEHITTTLEIAKADGNNEFILSRRQQIWNGVYVFAAITVFVLMMFYWGKSDKDMFDKVLRIIVIFGGGLGVGRGFFSKKN